MPSLYFLEACADDLSVIRELKEDNNCRVSTGQITIQDIPNLVVTAADGAEYR